ncbi:MAG: energy transducer TonB [Christiangramia sp.]|nr:energy transducer TonB [Christiangramia sp.]
MLYRSELSILSLMVLLISSVAISQKTDGEAVPFAVADKTPAYPGCEELAPQEIKDCTVEKINNHVNLNFNTGLGKQLGIVGQNRIVVKFKIDDQGKISNVQARSLADDAEAREALQKEASRVVNSLPQMQPGEYKAKPVAIMYSLPIIFATPKKTD